MTYNKNQRTPSTFSSVGFARTGKLTLIIPISGTGRELKLNRISCNFASRITSAPLKLIQAALSEVGRVFREQGSDGHDKLLYLGYTSHHPDCTNS